MRFKPGDFSQGVAVRSVRVAGARNQSTAKYVERMRSVNTEDVLKSAPKYLHPDRMQMVLVGPIERIKDAAYPEGTTRLEDFGEMVTGK